MSKKTNPATPRIEDRIVVFQEKTVRCTNYLSAPEVSAATTEDSSAVPSEQGSESGAATVSKTEAVGEGKRNPVTAQKKLAEKPERKGRGRKK